MTRRKSNRHNVAATAHTLKQFKTHLPDEYELVRAAAWQVLELLRGSLPPIEPGPTRGFKKTARLIEQGYRARKSNTTALRYLRVHHPDLYWSWRYEYLDVHRD